MEPSISSLASAQHSPVRRCGRIILLKTKSLPHDKYDTQFSKSDGVTEPDVENQTTEAHFVPVMTHQVLDSTRARLRELMVGPGHTDNGNGGGDNYTAAATSAQSRSYGGLIFTSQRAVEAFGAIVGELGPDHKPPPGLLIYAVGPATSGALRELSASLSASWNVIDSDIGSRDQKKTGADLPVAGSGAELVTCILNHYPAQYKSTTTTPPPPPPRFGTFGDDYSPITTTVLPLLFLTGDKRRDIIPVQLAADGRIGLDELVLYQTTEREELGADLRRMISPSNLGSHLTCLSGQNVGNVIDWIVVFSPAGCKVLIDTLKAGIECGDSEKDRKNKAAEAGSMIPLPASPFSIMGRDYYIITIGKTTWNFMVDTVGYTPHACAAEPSATGVSDAIYTFERDNGLLISS